MRLWMSENDEDNLDLQVFYLGSDISVYVTNWPSSNAKPENTDRLSKPEFVSNTTERLYKKIYAYTQNSNDSSTTKFISNYNNFQKMQKTYHI